MKVTEHPQSFIEMPVLADEFVLGGHTNFEGLPLTISGDWRQYIPKFEDQFKNGVETSACATYGTWNPIEILMHALYGIKDADHSDRFTAQLSGTTRQGNNPHKVAETIRKKWSVHEVQWSFGYVNSFEEYYKEPPRELKKLAKKNGLEWKFGHEWAVTNQTRKEEKRERIIDSLKVSPLGASVYAWAQDGDVYVKPDGVRDTHWCNILFADNDFYYILDTYPPYIKTLHKDYDFGYVKRYSLSRKQVTWLDKLIFHFVWNR